MTKPILDIIITHNDEPIEVGMPAFTMLRNQRLADFNEVHIIFVQNGEFKFNLDGLLTLLPYPYDVITIPNGGISEMRNAGIDAAEADFMMFCDFDDMFSDVWSLSSILKILPTKSYDILWMPYTEEFKIHGRYYHIATNDENTPTSIGKVFRTEFVKQKGLYFDTRLQFYEDNLFYLCAVEETSVKRYGKITMDIVYPYVKTHREDSRTHIGNYDFYIRRQKDLCMRGQYLIDWMEFRKKKITPAIANVVIENYFTFNRNTVPDALLPVRDSFAKFYRKHKEAFESVRKEDYEYSYDITERMMYSKDFDTYDTYGIEPCPVNRDVSLPQWLKTFEKVPTVLPEIHADITPVHKTSKPSGDRMRVAVYSGTRNIYENMLVSAKSLIANSNVDKVFFLIEDDEFPYELPKCIETRNVSDQDFFPKSSPNYNTSWSYMCLLRAAFTKLFPEYDRVLSLDIDTIVMDDVSSLWDIDMSDSYIAGVQETDDKKHGVYSEDGHTYLNFGVIMMNLDKLRNDHKDDDIINAINTTRYAFPEQDPFNVFCDGHVTLLDPAYNNTVYYHITDDSDNPKILHYAGIKYYKHFSQYQHYKNMSWDDVMYNHLFVSDGRNKNHPVRNNRRVVVYCGSRNTYRMMNVSIRSLLAHTQIDKLYLVIEDDTFPYELPEFAQCVNVSEQEYFNHHGPNYNSQYTFIPMLRAAYPDMFQDEQTMLSLDNDVIVERDISPLFDYDLSNHYFAAAQETRPFIRKPNVYYNTGVMLMNLRKMADDGIDRKAIDILNKEYFINDSQDVLNGLCKGHILDLPSDYNACDFTDETDNIIIRHYSGIHKDGFWKEAEQYENSHRMPSKTDGKDGN